MTNQLSGRRVLKGDPVGEGAGAVAASGWEAMPEPWWPTGPVHSQHAGEVFAEAGDEVGYRHGCSVCAATHSAGGSGRARDGGR